MAITTIDESRLRRAAQRAVVADPLQYTPPGAEKPRALGVEIETDETAISQKGVAGRFTNDAALMAHGAVALPGVLYEQGVGGSAKLLGEGFLESGKMLVGTTGILGGEQHQKSGEYYKNHPGFAVADVLSIASFGAGSLLKNSLTAIAKSSAKTAIIAGKGLGVSESVIRAALLTARSVANPARILGAERIAGTFERGLEHAVRTGDTTKISESVMAGLIKQGVKSDAAIQIAQSIARDAAEQIIKQASKLKNYDRVAHPVGTIFSASKRGITTATGRVLGTVEPTALGTILGAGGRVAINANKKAASEIERWAQKVVQEKGLPDTVENRTKELATWNDDPNYAALDPEGRFRHWENYVKSDINLKKLREMTPDSSKRFVSVKAISKESAEAMTETIDDNIGAIKEIATSMPGITPERYAELVWSKVEEFLADVGGADFANYSPMLRDAFGAGSDVEKLKQAIMSLTKERPSIAIRKWTPEQQAIVDKMRKSGYLVGYAPKNKGVSFASDVSDGVSGAGKVDVETPNVPPAVSTATKITESTFDDSRNWLGKTLEDWGFGLRGTFPGAKAMAFRLNFIQNSIKDIGAQFGSKIKINKPVVVNGLHTGVTKVTIPTNKLHDWIYKHKDEIFKLRKKEDAGIRSRLTSGKALRPVAVSDITPEDLVRIGFDPKVAQAVKDTAGKSMREVSPAVTGMLEHVVDIMRSGNNPFSRFYDATYKTALYARYSSVFAALFQFQQAIETKIVSAMLTKDWRLLPGVAAAKGAGRASLRLLTDTPFGARMTPKKVGGILQGAKTYLKEIVNEVSDNEMSISRDNLMGDVHRMARDQVNAAELVTMRATEDAGEVAGKTVRKSESAADIIDSTQIDGAWLGILGANYTAQGARIGKAMASRFGLTLEEVFEDFVERVDDTGKVTKIYKYQNLINEMQGAVTQALGYKTGMQTSPLMKTLNIIWFPFRFQAKSVELTAKWFGSLDPGTRLFVMNNWVHTANFMGTDEGIEWRRANKNTLYQILAYTTAWQQMGDSIEAVSRGQLFGGNTGIIGGIPFGFIYNFAQALAVLPEDPEQFDPATGKKFQFKEVPKNIVSERAFLTALEEFVFMMTPGMPLYTLTGGSVSGFSWRHMAEDGIEQFYPWLRGDRRDGSQETAQKLKSQTQRIKLDERRTMPQIINEFKP